LRLGKNWKYLGRHCSKKNKEKTFVERGERNNNTEETKDKIEEHNNKVGIKVG